MDKYLNVKKFKSTNYVQSIIKEELIISDDESDDCVGVKRETIDESFLDTENEENKFNGQINQKSGSLGNKNVSARNDKQLTLDLFSQSNNAKNNEQFENPKNITNDENPKNVINSENPGTAVKAARTSDNIDKLLKNLAKSYCHKCKAKRDVIRRKARCLECNIQLTYSCESCDKPYCTFTNLSYHLRAQHTVNRETHLCPVCNKSFAFRKVMLAHRRINHDSVVKSLTGNQQCAKCGKKFESKHITEHEKVCDAEAPFKCDKCPFASIYQSNLTNHVSKEHTNYKEKCKNCKKVFTNRKSMNRHLRVYCNKVKRFKCHHCGHKLYRKDEMLIHLDQLHFRGVLMRKSTSDTDVSRVCEYCDKSLNLYEKMKYHLRRCEFAPLEFRRQR